MRVRLLPALLAASALLAAPAAAQVTTPTPTPTPTPTVTPSPEPTATPEPTPERSDAVKAIYRDYRRDGELNACKHEKADLKEALKDLTDEDDAENPDLRYLLEAGIDEHKSGDCARQAQAEAEEDDTTGTGTTGTGTTTPSPVTPVTPATPAAPDSTFSPSTGDDGGSPDPLGAGDLTPVDPDATAVPPADAPPSTTIPPAEAGGAPIPAAPPAPVYTNADDGVPLSLVVLAAIAGIVALIALLLAMLSRTGWGERALAGPRRAWREAAFRAGGTWGDFADWMRVGR